MSIVYPISSLPVIEDLKVKQAKTFYKSYALQLNDAEWDLSNGTIYFKVQSAYSDNTPLITLSLDDTKMDDALKGQFTIQLTPEQTNKTPGQYLYEIRLVIAEGDSLFPNGLDIILYEGKFVITDTIFGAII